MAVEVDEARRDPLAAGVERAGVARALDPLVTGRQRPLCLVALTDCFQESSLVSAARRVTPRQGVPSAPPAKNADSRAGRSAMGSASDRRPDAPPNT